MRLKMLHFLTVPLAVMLWTSSTPCETRNDEEARKTALEFIVDRYTADCEAKSAFLNSRSDSVRQASALSCDKSSFFKISRESLVDQLLQENVEPKPYKVQYFINRKYFDSLNEM